MNKRQEQLLNLVIEHHIATAEPVGSRFLVNKGGLDWSEATVRNDLRALEEEGYLTHPHTSAGRLPTISGYRYYVDHLDLNGMKGGRRVEKVLGRAADEDENGELNKKSVAKAMAELSGETLLVAYSRDVVYYTGLSNLFHKPEFAEWQLAADVSEVFDHCEESLEDFFCQVDDRPKYFIGDEHNFGTMLSVLAARFGEDNESLVAMLGPLRMDYRRNWGIMTKALEMMFEE